MYSYAPYMRRWCVVLPGWGFHVTEVTLLIKSGQGSIYDASRTSLPLLFAKPQFVLPFTTSSKLPKTTLIKDV